MLKLKLFDKIYPILTSRIIKIMRYFCLLHFFDVLFYLIIKYCDLDTSLCQPAFPTITESPSNALNMCQPQYYLEQFNQYAQQQQPNGSSATAGSNSTNIAPHF